MLPHDVALSPEISSPDPNLPKIRNKVEGRAADFVCVRLGARSRSRNSPIVGQAAFGVGETGKQRGENIACP